MARVRTINRQRLGYRRIIYLLVYLVLVPTALLLALGFVMMFTGEARYNIVLGVLTVSFVAVVVTGGVLVWVFVHREARLSMLQADFVSKVSHELRTPLTAIRLLTETLARGPQLESDAAQCVASILEETERLTGRIERLLDWGAMEAGRKLYELRPMSVEDLLREVTATAGPIALHSGAQLVCPTPDALPSVYADGPALVEALGNLVSNAIKYGGTPSRVELSARVDGRYVSFDVRDNGEGIPPAEHRRIFDKFYRIDDRLSRTREGSGLGLAIVKHTAKALGGRVLVESEPGKGSTFRLQVPIADPSARPSSSRP
jgi:two-component system phosphate regulon sensor histidine kinase PhoR